MSVKYFAFAVSLRVLIETYWNVNEGNNQPISRQQAY